MVRRVNVRSRSPWPELPILGTSPGCVLVKPFCYARMQRRSVFMPKKLLLRQCSRETKKFETALGILRKEKITIDPEDPAAGRLALCITEGEEHYSGANKGNSDARTYLLTLKDIRIRNGLPDDLGAEAMMFDALEKVEKEIKKPLLRDDKKGMSLLVAEFDKINKKLGIRKEDLPKYEEELELKLAKDQLTEIKQEVVEEMSNQIKRKEFQDEKMVDVRSLDIRNFI
ncbi:hypothetical protein QJS10_CPB14g00264 [Acorus calamus]|uniref:ATP synthase 24 kDa subunit, mitochondrial n=1 Tax=Acorus calamus TaxID=4465 RepID=A0AAV9DBV2_ACOCL|nr:hypothetical protein QJS10_CPB14g00264 [Acorus calamus]